MNEREKMGLSPRVEATATELERRAALLGLPFDFRSVANSLATWEFEARLDSQRRQAAFRPQPDYRIRR